MTLSTSLLLGLIMVLTDVLGGLPPIVPRMRRMAAATEDPVVTSAEPEIEIKYEINRKWNGPKVAHPPVTLVMKGASDHMILHIDAPYFDDPPPPGQPGEALFKLWEYEVVELFFLNYNNQYLEVEVSPHGQHLVLLLFEKRNILRHSLPLDVNTTISGNTWSAHVKIPWEYFPPQVTKFNAYAVHVPGADRHYESLFPADSALSEPDFHALEYFQPIDLEPLGYNFQSDQPSQLWKDSMNSEIRYEIKTAWNGSAIDHKPVILLMKAAPDHLMLHIDAPFFNDPPPAAKPGEALWKLWENEVVELFFLNDDNQYLEVEVSPYGQHLVLLLTGRRDILRHSLPLDVTATITGITWTAHVKIPWDYFPPKVTKFNAYAMHVPGVGRHYESLYPANSSLTEPEFHALEFFRPFDMNSLLKENRPLSQLWTTSMESMVHQIVTNWNGSIVNHTPVTLLIKGSHNHMHINIEAPYFDDPAPLAEPGEAIWKLWEYEIIQMYFLNDEDNCIEINISPHGQHLAMMLTGKRHVLRHSLPLDVQTTISGNTWSAHVKIPWNYFPPKVTKFNAYAMHVPGVGRHYESLYPANSSLTEPDFHAFEFFQPFNMSSIQKGNRPVSKLWTESMERMIHQVVSNWNGSVVNHTPVTFLIKGAPGHMVLDIDAPYFNDPPPPANPGVTFWTIWNYEVVELFFANDDNQYLQVDVSPHGRYIVLLFHNERNILRHSLPLEITTKISGKSWTGQVKIPWDYFPPKVTKFNAGALHTLGEQRHYELLYPSNSSTSQVDFHQLQYFQPFNMTSLMKEERPISQIWSDSMDYMIHQIVTSWNGSIVNHPPVTFLMRGTPEHMVLRIEAPYFDDAAPPSPPGEALWKLWEYEVVELFFLNDDNQYLEVEVSPHGQHLVLLLFNKRNILRHSLPLDVTSTISGSTWSAHVKIPWDYFPPKVTKFNAYAMHVPGVERHYESLYHANSSLTEPEFHALEFFEAFNMSYFEEHRNISHMSELWRDSMKLEIKYEIEKQWNGSYVDHSPTTLVMHGAPDHLMLHIDAPYFNDPPPPSPPGEPLFKLWEYEVVEVFFLNDDKQYLEVEVSPHGQHLVLLLFNKRNILRHSLPLDVTSTISGNTWSAHVKIPWDYFPPKVNLFNAYAVHVPGAERHYESLYPANSSLTEADFHALEFFKALDLDSLNKNYTELPQSQLWTDAMERTHSG